VRFCDISTLGKLRVSGAAAHDFIRIMFTADTEALAEPGTTAASLLLTGESEIIDVVLIIRTGDDEYMVTTSPSTAGEVFAWLKAHAGISDDEGALFEGLAITDETKKLAGVVLFGEGSAAALDELAGKPLGAFPQVGHLTMAQLDTVPTLIFASPVLPVEAEVYELFCPPASVQGLICALLSFPEIDPMNAEEYQELREQNGTWFAQADDAAYAFPDEAGLMRLTRAAMDFVGGQALANRLSNT
jgi:glycine cleavage system aminomethyltransferase T